MDKFFVQTIDYQETDAPYKITRSIKNTGFAIINNHGISNDLINDVYSNWADFFESKVKHDYLFDVDKQDGYFPYKSENAQGYSTKDLKEFFHIYRFK